MALPWILLAAATALALEYRAQRKQLLQQRYRGNTQSDSIGIEPSEWWPGTIPVTPQPGAVVVCFVYGVVEHSGLWLGDDTIAELHGSGLVRGVSAKRFLAGRSGATIFVGCDKQHQPLHKADAVNAAAQQLLSYRDYHLRHNNCHRFVWQCLSGEDARIVNFAELNRQLSQLFRSPIYWDPINRAAAPSLAGS
ncbi:hypothetical protein [uncultured Ferrimonas sp.]|uniref:hypothetical protein n=1 Tax=uncultured Ferrimonas sp. TaxID=432640 RepID=UPI00261B0A82|nr:hypothetical protein [uncultured Ferrimonas sp.]